MGDVPTAMAQEHAQPPRFRPSRVASADVVRVPLGTDYTDHLTEGGFPDIAESGLKYAAGQRAQARAVENRASLTTGPGDTSTPTMYPGGTGAGQPNNQANDESPDRAAAAKKAAS